MNDRRPKPTGEEENASAVTNKYISVADLVSARNVSDHSNLGQPSSPFLEQASIRKPIKSIFNGKISRLHFESLLQICRTSYLFSDVNCLTNLLHMDARFSGLLAPPWESLDSNFRKS